MRKPKGLEVINQTFTDGKGNTLAILAIAGTDAAICTYRQDAPPTKQDDTIVHFTFEDLRLLRDTLNRILDMEE